MKKRLVKTVMAFIMVSILSFCISFYCSAAIGTDGNKFAITGDVNFDNLINIKDLVRMKKFISDKNVEINVISADLNGDKDLKADDLILMQKYLLGIDDSIVTGGNSWSEGFN